MSKSTVVFNTNQVVVEGGKPWLDSEGNEAYPEVIFGSDVSERLEKAEAEIEKLLRFINGIGMSDQLKAFCVKEAKK